MIKMADTFTNDKYKCCGQIVYAFYLSFCTKEVMINVSLIHQQDVSNGELSKHYLNLGDVCIAYFVIYSV